MFRLGIQDKQFKVIDSDPLSVISRDKEITDFSRAFSGNILECVRHKNNDESNWLKRCFIEVKKVKY